ncbi:MAG: RNAse [Rhodocyclaceae bacterium]|nr:RNAse [Rhodocyclaceae bacterium]
MNLARLTKAIGYRFADEGLLLNAVTHRSHSSPHNERLEFLGDGLLNCAIAAELYRRYPELPEGGLSRLRAHLVRQESLHKLAQVMHLGDFLRLGEGEMKSGGHQRPSILADALEAIFGAIYLDGGFEAVQQVILRLYAGLFDELLPGQSMKDPKTRLQEWLQGRKKALPRYVVLETTGAAHSQQFKVACEIDSFGVRTVGEGGSRRLAEQVAAENALKALNA